VQSFDATTKPGQTDAYVVEVSIGGTIHVERSAGTGGRGSDTPPPFNGVGGLPITGAPQTPGITIAAAFLTICALRVGRWSRSRWLMKSDRRWCGGLHGIRPRRRWHCGRGSCWPARTAVRKTKIADELGCRRVAVGTWHHGSPRCGWRGWSTHLGLARRARSATWSSSRGGRNAGDHAHGRHTMVDPVDGPAARDHPTDRQ
jgi:hypothetical protein